MKSQLRSLLAQFPVLESRLRLCRDALDRAAPSLTTPWGFTLAGAPHMASGEFEPTEIALVRSLLGEADILVNVGANVGLYCCHALSLGKRVVAFEPVSRNLHYLLRNISENGGSSKAEVFPVAVGPGADVVTIWGSGTGASLVEGWAGIPSTYRTQVPQVSLDRICQTFPAAQRLLILIDVEGAEHGVIKGAQGLLVRDPKPVWLVEITSFHNQPDGVDMNPNYSATFEQFFRQGYRAFATEAPSQPITSKDVSAWSCGEGTPASYNFLFVHESTPVPLLTGVAD